MGCCVATGFWPGAGAAGSEILPFFSDLNLIGAIAGQNFGKPYSEESENSFPIVGGTAYFAYVGRAIRNFTANFVAVQTIVAGTGAQVAECGFFSTPAPPNKAAQSLTKIAASVVMDSFLAFGNKRNTVALGAAITAGAYVWCGLRIDMAGAEPSLRAIGREFGEGALLSEAAAASFAGAGPWAGAVIADGVTSAPMLVLEAL